MRDPRNILITGASSGLGEALALAYAGPGVRLALSGRDGGRLEEVAGRARELGAVVAARVLDVGDRAGMAAWLAQSDGGEDGAGPLDLVIANAGISAGSGGGLGEDEEQARAILRINVEGVLNTVYPALALMRGRRRGQIALMASLAGFRGVGGAPAYGASKAAVRVLGEGLRGMVAAEGIEVSVICPGFVKSRMTAVNDFPMPFLMEADRAAAIIRVGLAANRGRIAFPWPMAALVWLVAALPAAWSDRILAGLPRKAAGGVAGGKDARKA